MNKIKLVICDIDSTLIPYGYDDISYETSEAFKKLKNSNIDLLIATGRHYHFIQPKLFKHLNNQYIVTINGACLSESNGNPIAYKPLDSKDFNTLIQLCVANNIKVGCKFKDNIVTYNLHQEFIDTYLKNQPELKSLIIDGTRTKDYHLTHDYPLGIFIIGNEEIIESFKNKIGSLCLAKSYPNAYDVFAKNQTKAEGIETYLKLKHISWDECIAFGDAANDIPMLEKAKIGVTFKDSSEEVKKAADYITDSCINNGVVAALKHFKII